MGLKDVLIVIFATIFFEGFFICLLAHVVYHHSNDYITKKEHISKTILSYVLIKIIGFIFSLLINNYGCLLGVNPAMILLYMVIRIGQDSFKDFNYKETNKE